MPNEVERAQYQLLPQCPGVYLMRDARRRVLYVGKAVNLRRRVASYFQRTHDPRLTAMVEKVRKVAFVATDSAVEALLLEAALIKKYQPPYNIKEKDDKSFLYIEITDEPFPRVLLVRGTAPPRGERFGPFTSAHTVRNALRLLRKIFPFHTHPPRRVGKGGRPCLEYELGLCPGTCAGAVSACEYRTTIRNLKLFLLGKKDKVLRLLAREMERASKELRFEDAARIRKQIFALRHIQDAALIDRSFLGEEESAPPVRVEGYDISNISGRSAVGSMVVFRNGEPAKSEYRKFRIRTVAGANDTAMLAEVLRRRLAHHWPLPMLILVDGGIAQVNAARRALEEAGVRVPVVGMAKGRDRKGTTIVGKVPAGISHALLVRVRDEAHRFAVSYHRRLRSRTMLGNSDAGKRK
ncbi:excinuclease ABC subunit UvrC [Candidatus Parcubacteria bacterium]|nr:MAG: excinuclease ABC subunit UvrC [Candidatus Parcubacteria bacterium]